MEEYSTFFKTGRNVRLAVAGYQEIGIDYLKLSLVQLIMISILSGRIYWEKIIINISKHRYPGVTFFVQTLY